MTPFKHTLTLALLTLFVAGCDRSSHYHINWRFEELRNEVFELPDLGVTNENSDRLAIKVEFGHDDYCDSLTAAFDGSLTITTSDGRGIMGAGLYPKGAQMAVEFLEFSEGFEGELKEVSEFPLPEPGSVRFYIIKQNHTLGGQFKEDDLLDNTLKLSPLYKKAQKLIEHIRAFDKEIQMDEPVEVVNASSAAGLSENHLHN